MNKPGSSEGLTGPRRVLVLVLSILVVFGAIGLGRFGYTMILPPMQEGLSLDAGQAGDVAAANMTGYMLLTAVSGFLAARFGAAPVVIISMFLASLTMFLTGGVPGFGSAVFLRFITGAASGGANIAVMGLIAEWFPPRARGRAAGITVSGSSFGILATGFFVPLILRQYGGEGWRYSWYFLGITAALISLLCLFFLRDPPRKSAKHGSGASGAAEKGRRTGTIIKKVFAQKYLWILAGIYTAFGFSYVIYATFFTRVLLNTGGYTEREAGFLWSLVGAVSITAAFFWGWFSDRLGRKYALAMVYGLQGLSFGLFVLWPQPPGFLISALLFGITGWSIPAIMAASSGDLLGARYAGTAFGIVTLFFGIGQIAGPFIAGRIALAGGSYAGAYGLASAAAFTGAVLSLLFLPRRMDLR